MGKTLQQRVEDLLCNLFENGHATSVRVHFEGRMDDDGMIHYSCDVTGEPGPQINEL